MAEGGNEPIDPEEYRKKCDVREVRELFRGRFTDREAHKLLTIFEWDKGRTVQNILNSESGKLRELLESFDVEERISVVTMDGVLRDLARRQKIIWEIRQFACGDDDKMWWRRVPTRKPVSRCHSCRRKFDALQRDQEWGLAEFECVCGSTFKGIGAMGEAESMCYRCGRMCSPMRILPPMREQREAPRVFRNNHSCNAPNCYNRKGRVDHRKVCTHPKSRGITVLHASDLHESTGSTVKTFLDQTDLDPPYEPSLGPITENDEDDDSIGGRSGGSPNVSDDGEDNTV